MTALTVPCFVTRDQREAERLRRYGVTAYAVFANATGMRFDDVYITFNVKEPISYCPEYDDASRFLAKQLRAEELHAINTNWATALRDARKAPVWLRGHPDELP